jgi:hypothetical protein
MSSLRKIGARDEAYGNWCITARGATDGYPESPDFDNDMAILAVLQDIREELMKLNERKQKPRRKRK